MDRLIALEESNEKLIDAVQDLKFLVKLICKELKIPFEVPQKTKPEKGEDHKDDQNDPSAV